MSRSDDGEVPPIQRRDPGHPEPFGERDDRGIHRPERQVVIRGDEIGDPEPVGGPDRFRDEVAGGEVAEEAHPGARADPASDQERDLGDDQLRNQEWAGLVLEQTEAPLVVPVTSVDAREQRSAVDDQWDPKPSRSRISSIRAAMSFESL